MSKILTPPKRPPHKHAPSSEKAASGRVFKLSLKDSRPVDAKMWAQMESAARTPRKDGHYPDIVEAPDAVI
ncbi:hypothetical protein D3C87_286000 [compost metagenome]|jgi:hypothetical protein|uniref:hypothetical protein n=1 Tax=Achromobacter sp. Root83 TaxID=1736602 RepID=UPI000B2F5650|nr:hypothetical protein [Achromobacter sp. Root83]